MASLQYVQRKYREGKVVAYVSKNKSKVRYKLLKIDKKFLTATLRVKPEYPLGDADKLNKDMDSLEVLVDTVINELLADNPKIYLTVKIIDKAIADRKKAAARKAREVKEANDKQLLLYDFKIFNTRKLEELVKKDLERGLSRKTPPTIKDYISCCNALEDFEYDYNCTLRLSDVDEDFLDDFKYFLSQKHESTEEHEYKCEGGMVNKTINKRLECLSAFVRSFYGDIEKA